MPHWAIQEMDYFERQELGDEESRVEKKIQKKIPSSKQAVDPGNKRKQHSVQNLVSNEGNKRPRVLTANTNTSTDLKLQRRQQLNHATIIQPTIRRAATCTSKSVETAVELPLNGSAFSVSKDEEKGKQVLYLCQSCPRIHDNLALRLALDGEKAFVATASSLLRKMLSTRES